MIIQTQKKSITYTYCISKLFSFDILGLHLKENTFLKGLVSVVFQTLKKLNDVRAFGTNKAQLTLQPLN